MAGRPGDIRAGGAFVELYADNSPFVRGLRGAEARLKAFGAEVGRIGAGMAKLGAMIVVPAVLAIKSASKLQETMGKFRVVFGAQAAAVELWGDTFAKQIGRSKQQIKDFLASAQDLFVPLGFEPARATELSKQITGLAIDLASFNNKIDLDVMRDLQAALTGSGEVMKKYGVIVSEAAVKQEMLNQGLDPTVATNQQKVFARLNIILAGTTAAQGDADRTAGSFANQMKRLRGNVSDLAADLGTALLPAVTKLVEDLQGIITATTEWVKANGDLIVRVVKIGAVIGVAGVALMGFNQIVLAGAGILQVGRLALKGFGIALAAITAHPIIAAMAAAAAAVTALIVHVKREHDRAVDEMIEDRIALTKAEAAAEAAVAAKAKAAIAAKAHAAAKAELATRERALAIETQLAAIRDRQADRMKSAADRRLAAIRKERAEQMKLLSELERIERARRGGPRAGILGGLATQRAAGHLATSEAMRLITDEQAARRATEHGRRVAANIAQLARARALRTGEAPDVAALRVRHEKYLAQQEEYAATEKRWGRPTPPKPLDFLEFVRQAVFEGRVPAAAGLLGGVDVRGTFLGQAVGGMAAAGPTDKLVNNTANTAKHAKSILELLRIGPRFK